MTVALTAVYAGCALATLAGVLAAIVLPAPNRTSEQERRS